MIIIKYDGREFYAENNTALPNKTSAGVEKARVNEIVGSDHRWKFVLDAYAGIGISSYIFSKYAKRVLAGEEPRGSALDTGQLLPQVPHLTS